MILSAKIVEFIKETVGSLESEAMEMALNDVKSVFDGEVFHLEEHYETKNTSGCQTSAIMDKVKALSADQNIYRVDVDDSVIPEYEEYISVWFTGTSEDDVIARLQLAWNKYQASEG